MTLMPDGRDVAQHLLDLEEKRNDNDKYVSKSAHRILVARVKKLEENLGILEEAVSGDDEVEDTLPPV